ncbi:MAG: hypothetical protein Kow0069_13330 [Promethearchaeota archaeon]
MIGALGSVGTSSNDDESGGMKRSNGGSNSPGESGRRSPTTRFDHVAIAQVIPAGAKVLDLGCGEGDLLHLLAENKGVEGYGVDVFASHVKTCIAKGLLAYQGDLDEGLEGYAPGAVDVVVLNDTLRFVKKPAKLIRSMVKIGRVALVGIRNAAHWRRRLSALLGGTLNSRDPISSDSLPERPFTIKTFLRFCHLNGIHVVSARYFAGGRPRGGFMANLLADYALFTIASREKGQRKKNCDT